MRYSVPLFIVFAFFACQSEIELDNTDRLGLAYFPLEVGSYRVYDVQDITYNLIGPEESSYELREEIADSVVISAEEVRYVLKRYKRLDELDDWELDSTWTLRSNNNRIVVTENNVSFVKMVFPIENGLEWDANIFNSRQSEFYRYADQPLDTLLSDSLYENTIKVVQSDLGVISIGKDERYEVFAEDIGLLIKYSSIWEFFQENGEVDTDKIVGGQDLVQTLIEYGKKGE